MRLWQYGLLLLTLITVTAVRLRLLSVPLERDEGEYAYLGQLLLQGVPPYREAYSMKLPGVYGMYAVFMGLFGQTPEGIRFGLLLLNLLTAVFIYFLARRLFAQPAGTVAAVSFVFLSLSPSLLGLFAHATHFVIFFAMAGYLLLPAGENNRHERLQLFGSGICFGLAYLMKQHGLVFLLFALSFLVYEEYRRPGSYSWVRIAGKCALLCGGATLPVLLTLVLLVKAGVFARFWFWTVTYAREYAAQQPQKPFQLFCDNFLPVTRSALPFWVLGGGGLAVMATGKIKGRKRWFCCGLLVCSLLATIPGWYFRAHYFILVLPAVALLAGGAATAFPLLPTARMCLVSNILAALVIPVAMGYSLFREWPVYFSLTPRQVARSIAGSSPFPESLQIGDYLRSHTTPAERIAVLGSEPQIYFYAGRRAAIGQIYMYGLMEPQPYALRMQQELVSELEAANPAYLVLANISMSWLARPDSERYLLDWLNGYIPAHYDLVGVVDIVDFATTVYRWDAATADYAPQSKNHLLVYRNRANIPKGAAQ